MESRKGKDKYNDTLKLKKKERYIEVERQSERNTLLYTYKWYELSGGEDTSS